MDCDIDVSHSAKAARRLDVLRIRCMRTGKGQLTQAQATTMCNLSSAAKPAAIALRDRVHPYVSTLHMQQEQNWKTSLNASPNPCHLPPSALGNATFQGRNVWIVGSRGRGICGFSRGNHVGRLPHEGLVKHKQQLLRMQRLQTTTWPRRLHSWPRGLGYRRNRTPRASFSHLRWRPGRGRHAQRCPGR